MRISDWSSDVCSSDRRKGGDGSLLTAFWVMPQTRLPSDAHGNRHNHVEWDRESTDVQLYGDDYQIPLPLSGASFEFYGHGLDRKSVVEGKVWSVSVDPGGRRLIKTRT